MNLPAIYDLPIHTAETAAARRTYRVDASGQVFSVSPAKHGRNQLQHKKLKPMPLDELVKTLAADANSHSRAIRDKFPHQLVPGVWQLRFGIDHQPPAWLHQTTLDEFLRRHAIGPDRADTPSWNKWPEEVSAVASALDPSDCRAWFLIGGNCSMSDSAVGRLNDPDRVEDPIFRTLNHCPFIILGPVAFWAIRSSFAPSNRFAK